MLSFFPLWPIAAATAALLSEVWLRRQPVWDGVSPLPRLTLAGRAVGIVMRPGVRLAGGAPGKTEVYSFVAWTLAGWFVVGAACAAWADWPGRRVVHGLLAALLGAAAGIAAGIAVGALIVKVTNMSSVEGKSGFFVLGIALLGGVAGLLAGTVTGAIFAF